MYNHKSKNSPPTLANDVAEIFLNIVVHILNGAIFLIKILVTKTWEAYQRSKGNYRNEPLTHAHIERKTTAKEKDALGKTLSRGGTFKYDKLDTTTHTGIFGSTGFGKSVLMETLMDRSLSMGQPFVYFDPKPSQESIARFRQMTANYGKNGQVLCPFDKDSLIINPFLFCNANETLNIIMSSLQWSETFYKNECEESLLEAITSFTKIARPPTIRGIIDCLEAKSNKKTISGLISQLRSLNNSNLGRLVDTDSGDAFRFEDLSHRNECLYIGIPSMGIGSSGNILNRIFFGCLARYSNFVLAEADFYKDFSFAVYFDELSSTVHEGFVDLQNKCRASRIELIYATQCPSDLDRISKDFKNQVIENTNNYFVFNQVVPEHTDLFSSIAGTCPTIKSTYVAENDTRSGKSSERETESMIAHPNIFRDLKVGQCVFIQRKPGKRVDLLKVSMKKIEKLRKIPKLEYLTVEKPESAF